MKDHQALRHNLSLIHLAILLQHYLAKNHYTLMSDSSSLFPGCLSFFCSTKTCFRPSLPENPTAVIFLSAIFASGILPISDSTSISKLTLLIFGIGWFSKFAQSDM